MVSRRLYAYLVVAAAFLVGAICGGGAAFAYVSERHAAILREDARGPETRRLRILSRKLDLDADQEQRIRDILTKERETMRDLGRDMMERCGAPLREHKSHVDAEIRAVLRPDQQRRYDELREKRRERMWLGPGPRRPRDDRHTP